MNTPLLLTGLAFLAVFLGVFGVNLLISDLLQRSQQRRREELEQEATERDLIRAKEFVRYTRNLQLEELPSDVSEMPNQGIGESVERILEESQIQVSVSTFFVLSVAAGCGAMSAVITLTGSVLFGAVAGIVVLVLPIKIIQQIRDKRRKAIREQLPDALELMSRVLRAGQSIWQAMQAVGQEFPAPLGPEFLFCYEQQNLGMPTTSALRELSRRTGVLEVKLFTLALLVHQQTGGNLAKMLDRLSGMVRSRFVLNGKVNALTAEGKFQALILLLLPLAMFLLLLILNAPYAMQLFDHQWLLVAMLCSMTIGMAWVRRIVNFDF